MSTTFERRERRTRAVTEAVWWPDRDGETVTSETTVTTRYAVENGPAVPMYTTGRSDRLYVITTVVVTHRSGSKASPDIELRGHLRRKNGTLGETVHALYPYGSTYARKPWPEWLIELVQDSAR